MYLYIAVSYTHLDVYKRQALKMNNNAIAIIGGADGPTSVFVAGKLNSVLVSILLIALGVVMLIVCLLYTSRCV